MSDHLAHNVRSPTTSAHVRINHARQALPKVAEEEEGDVQCSA